MSTAEDWMDRRTVLASDGVVALVEVSDAEAEDIVDRCDLTFDHDPDDRPVPVAVPRFWAGIVVEETGELLGAMSWRPVPHLTVLSGIAWNQGFQLLPETRGRGLSKRCGMLLTRYLFETTGVDRVQAITDVQNVAAWRG